MKPASQSGPKRPFMADLLPLAYAADNETLPEIGFVDFQALAHVVVSELVSGMLSRTPAAGAGDSGASHRAVVRLA